MNDDPRHMLIIKLAGKKLLQPMCWKIEIYIF